MEVNCGKIGFPLNSQRNISVRGKVITTYPGLPENLYEAVAKHAEMTPDKLAVEDSFGHRFTYGELKRTVDRFCFRIEVPLWRSKG